MGNSKRARIPTPARYRYPSKWSKSFIAWLFRTSITDGVLGLQFADEIVEVGSGPFVCTIAPPSFIRMIWLLFRPDFLMPSHYTKGYWCCENEKLYDFLELLTAQNGSPLHWWFRLFNRSPVRDRLVYWLFPLKVKENIAIHYNTSPKFMKLILGERLEYTCAFFDDEHADLSAAQDQKIGTVIERLGIERHHRVLDLGCGWGQIAEAVSGQTGAHVTGVNLTKNQIAFALHNHSKDVDFVQTEYQAFLPKDSYDRIYSIGMLEHIGRGKLDQYFGKISEMLSVDGKALVHCIVRDQEGSTNSWIDQEVFPGAYIPELSDIIKTIERSDLNLDTVFTHDKSNYFRTLHAWANNFYAKRGELETVLKELVPTEDASTVMRIWEFYLCGSRLVFNDRNGYCYNVQIVLTN